MLLDCYSYLDKQVSKYAYLKKKYSNAGILNECNVDDFNKAIGKRNIIARTLKLVYGYSDAQIKSAVRNITTNVTGVNCDRLIDVINRDDFISMD